MAPKPTKIATGPASSTHIATSSPTTAASAPTPSGTNDQPAYDKLDLTPSNVSS